MPHAGEERADGADERTRQPECDVTENAEARDV
jgi:hypothetical protein